MSLVVPVAFGVTLGILLAAATIAAAYRWGPLVADALGRLVKAYWKHAAAAAVLIIVAMVALVVAALRVDQIVKQSQIHRAGLASTPADLSSASLLGAAFRQANFAVAELASPAAFQGEIDPSHNPFDAIRGTDVEPYWEMFVRSPNEKQTRALMNELRLGRIADITRLRKDWPRSQWALLVAAFVDVPTLLLGLLGYWLAARTLGY